MKYYVWVNEAKRYVVEAENVKGAALKAVELYVGELALRDVEWPLYLDVSGGRFHNKTYFYSASLRESHVRGGRDKIKIDRGWPIRRVFGEEGEAK